MMVVFGVDVSHYQPNFNFLQAKAEGYQFAIHKVSEGSEYIDPSWNRARSELLQHFPNRCGGYVFSRPNVSPVQEADNLEKVFGDKSEMSLMIDYEYLTFIGSADDLSRRIDEYTKRGFHLLPVYLPRWYWERMGSPDISFLKDLGVWQSHYVDGQGYGSILYEKVDSNYWKSYGGAPVKVLQFSSKANIAGVRETDADAVQSPLILEQIFNKSDGRMGSEDPLTIEEQREILTGAEQLSYPHVPLPGVIGPRPLRNPSLYNVAGNDPTKQQAWIRAMIMDIWNEMVFDGYPVNDVAAGFDERMSSLVEIVAATYVMTKKNQQLLLKLLDNSNGKEKVA